MLDRHRPPGQVPPLWEVAGGRLDAFEEAGPQGDGAPPRARMSVHPGGGVTWEGFLLALFFFVALMGIAWFLEGR